MHVFFRAPRDRGLHNGQMLYDAPSRARRDRRMSPCDPLYHDVLFESSYPCEDPAEIFKKML